MTDPTELGGQARDASVWQRVLSSAALDAIAAGVQDWKAVHPLAAVWLTGTALPAGWQRLTVADDAEVPLRVAAVRADEPAQTWAACQALSAFRFTGTPSPELLYANSDHALQTFGAVGIRTDPIVLPERSDIAAVRSSGYLEADGQRLWVRYSTYLRGSDDPLHGLVVEEIVATTAESYLRLGHDIGALTRSASDAFTARIGLTAADLEQAVADHGDRLRAEVAGGPVLSDEQRRFLSRALSMWGGVASWLPLPIAALGYADWAAFDDDIARMQQQLDDAVPGFSSAEWTRALLLAEISFASDLLGAGVEFGIVSEWRDPEALVILRSIQRALRPFVDASLLSASGHWSSRSRG